MKSGLIPVLMMVVMVLLSFGCTSTVDVDRVSAGKNIDLSGSWNDTDIRTVSEELIRNCMKSSWYTRFTKENKRDPVIIVGNFSNLSSERIDTSIITKKMEIALVDSGKFGIVASREEREPMRDELMDQQIYANPQTARKMAMETGADFMLIGSVKTVTDQLKNTTVQTYYVSAELVELETTGKVWLDEATIKKVIKRSTVTW